MYKLCFKKSHNRSNVGSFYLFDTVSGILKSYEIVWSPTGENLKIFIILIKENTYIFIFSWMKKTLSAWIYEKNVKIDTNILKF